MPTFPDDTPGLRRAIIETARALPRLGLTKGTSGNVSARTESGFLVTPSGTPYENLTEDMIVPLDWDGGYRGETLPSSEWRMHLDFYLAKPDCGAVVHCHSPRATALSCHRRSVRGDDRSPWRQERLSACEPRTDRRRHNIAKGTFGGRRRGRSGGSVFVGSDTRRPRDTGRR